jgi:hypothetical protein
MTQLPLFDAVEIQLTKGYVTLVDPIDADLSVKLWTVDLPYPPRTTTYAVRREGNKKVYMHRVILERFVGRPLSPSECVDHINRDGIDNRRSNLRLATKASNSHNTTGRPNASSKYKGVSWNKHAGKWMAQIKSNGDHLYLGIFENEEEAAEAYSKAAHELHGAFARTE